MGSPTKIQHKKRRLDSDTDSRKATASDAVTSGNIPAVVEQAVSQDDVDGSVRKRPAPQLECAPQTTSSHSPQQPHSPFIAANQHSPSTASESARHNSPAPSTSHSLPSHSQPLDSSIQHPLPSVPYTARPRAAGGRFVGKVGGPGDAKFQPSAAKTTERLSEEAERLIGGATGRGGRRKKE